MRSSRIQIVTSTRFAQRNGRGREGERPTGSPWSEQTVCWSRLVNGFTILTNDSSPQASPQAVVNPQITCSLGEFTADCNRTLTSRSFSAARVITLFRGSAGTGKSFALQAVNQGLTEAGHSMLVVTPQRQQAIDLAEAGFQETQTVSELSARQRMPSGAVVLVDLTDERPDGFPQKEPSS